MVHMIEPFYSPRLRGDVCSGEFGVCPHGAMFWPWGIQDEA